MGAETGVTRLPAEGPEDGQCHQKLGERPGTDPSLEARGSGPTHYLDFRLLAFGTVRK